MNKYVLGGSRKLGSAQGGKVGIGSQVPVTKQCQWNSMMGTNAYRPTDRQTETVSFLLLLLCHVRNVIAGENGCMRIIYMYTCEVRASHLAVA